MQVMSINKYARSFEFIRPPLRNDPRVEAIELPKRYIVLETDRFSKVGESGAGISVRIRTIASQLRTLNSYRHLLKCGSNVHKIISL